MFLSPTKLLSKLDLAVVQCATKWPSYKPPSRQSSDNSEEPYETKLYRYYILRHRIISIISGSDLRQRNGSQNAILVFQPSLCFTFHIGQSSLTVRFSISLNQSILADSFPYLRLAAWMQEHSMTRKHLILIAMLTYLTKRRHGSIVHLCNQQPTNQSTQRFSERQTSPLPPAVIKWLRSLCRGRADFLQHRLKQHNTAAGWVRCWHGTAAAVSDFG